MCNSIEVSSAFVYIQSKALKLVEIVHTPVDQVDAAGNAWVAGYTESALDNNTHFGDWDIFLMKFDALGGHLWTRQRGGPGWEYANAIEVERVRG